LIDYGDRRSLLYICDKFPGGKIWNSWVYHIKATREKVMDINNAVTHGRRPGRRLLLSLLALGLAGLVLPLGSSTYTSVSMFGISEVQAGTQQVDGSTTGHDQEVIELIQAGGPDWRAVRKGVEGTTSVHGQETNKLIQAEGQIWRDIRNEFIAGYGSWWLALIVFALASFHVVVGGSPLEHRTGIKVPRWTKLERNMHWTVAILFIILAVTGMSLLWGRTMISPLLGKDVFATYAWLAKYLHNYLALLFMASLIIMLIVWLRQALFIKADLDWFKKLGGYFGGAHAPAGKVNAGEKIWYWSLFVAGIALCVSGLYLLFPSFGWERETMQLAHIVHAVCSVYLMGFSLLHIYLGTVGSEGAFEGMISGEVDEGWALQHHDLWYDDIRKPQS